ncbi:21614_t:CDS:2 [Dentiscutata erythropus]|uniref:21614_t:CDS:1 n=1 Tax=Dentiscutata erythropus TaxID=1348616 RepID=A0A9N8W0V8_9GLOM|nr:21614_t:CDS:2 [Dentiscutata erythropus]
MGQTPTEKDRKLSFKKSDIFYILLIFVPVGYIVNFLSSNDTLIFITNFLAIISSAKLMRFASNELIHHLNKSYKTLEDILDVAFNNLVELIITINALVNGQIRVVQAALLGSILSHTLLVLGIFFLVGGIKILYEGKLEEEFTIIGGSKGTTVAQMTSSVLTLACISLVLPAAFGFFVTTSTDKSIEGIVASHKISKAFIGLILLPIVSHCDKYISSAYIERNNHNNECANKRFAIIVISVRSSIQTALIITPILVILGWIINQPMSLSFSIFETVCLVIAVILKNYLVQMGNQIG